MTLLAGAEAARLLGIHPKTLQQWLQAAQMTWHPHPHDARIKGLMWEQVEELAQLHHRQLQPQASPRAASARKPASMGITPNVVWGAADLPASDKERPPSASEGVEKEAGADLLVHFASLEQQVARLTEQVAQLTRVLSTFSHPLGDQVGRVEVSREPGPPPAGYRTVPAAVAAAFPPGAKAPTQRPPHPGEMKSPQRLRPLPLIEYGAEGRYIVICPLEGELALVPDSREWFLWFATLSSFRFVGQCGRFTAYRTGTKRSPKRSWVAYRAIHQREYKYTIGTTDRLSIARLEELAAKLQAHLTAF